VAQLFSLGHLHTLMNEDQGNSMIRLLADIKDQLVALTDRVAAVELEIGRVGGDLSEKLDTIDGSIGSVDSSISSLETTVQLKD